MAVYSYPGPRSADYKKPSSVDDCIPQARALTAKLVPSDRPTGPVVPEFRVRKGDRLLIVTVPDQDKYVAEAVTQVLTEGGAEEVRFIYPKELTGRDPERYSVEDGWREVALYEEGKASGTTADLLTGMGLAEATTTFLDTHPEYTGVFLDVAGGNSTRAFGKHRDKLRGTWPCNNWEWFLSRAHNFPLPLWEEMERRILEPLAKASEVRITDPEGTNIEFSLTAEEAIRWYNNAFVRGHLMMNPFQVTAGEFHGRLGYDVRTPPVFPKANGVLAGTANHCGFFPRIELYFERDRLVEVKGGGRYGDGIRELMDKHNDIQWPGYHDKGLFWLCDTALCTAVGAFRRKSDLFESYWVYPNLPERSRAGVFHLGFGSRAYRDEKTADQYCREHGVQRGHIHVHNYFATFEVRLRGTDYWYKIVDKGQLAALSDPELRAMAAQYGHPDELLKYDWIPPLPGINCEGDYLKDYAPDPTAYLKKRIEEGKTI
ncbi:MAG: hypothetical protein HYY30_02965 [Chloroflexi bacterium]|nr:hypothetical protein [Chloroflexota bacterium]